MNKQDYWIQEAKPKKGALSAQLGIAQKDNIPMTLLNKIIKAKPGDIVKNPTMVGKKKIKVTRLLERRAILARNFKNMAKR